MFSDSSYKSGTLQEQFPVIDEGNSTIEEH